MTYTLESRTGELLNDPIAVQILEKYAPGISQNPMILLVKGMTLSAVISLPQAQQYGITKAIVEKVLTEIEELKKK